MGLEFSSEAIEASSEVSVQAIVQEQDQQSGKMILSYEIDTDQAGVQLPSDFLKTPDTGFQPQAFTFSVSSNCGQGSEKERNLVEERSLILTAFNILLYRYTQQDTIDLELTIGSTKIDKEYTTIIRTHIQSHADVQAQIAAVANAMRSAQNRLSDLQTLISSTLSNQQARLPIAVSFIETDSSTNSEAGYAASLRQTLSKRFDGLDLHLIVLQQGDATQAIVRYNANLFKPDTIERLAGHGQVLIQGMMQQPECPVAQLPMLTEAEERQLLIDWNSAPAEFPQTPIHEYIEAHAAEQPTAIALRFKSQSLTYAELNQRANQLAHYLMQLGVQTEDRIAVCVEPSLDILVSLLAIFKAGATYVPFDPTHPSDRLSAIAEDTQPKILLTQAHLVPNLPALADFTFCLDTDWHKIQPLPTHNPNLPTNLDQLAYLVYTSGTTGKPKGVMATHRNLVNYILAAQKQFRFDRHDVMPAIARFTFSITMFELFSPLVAGGTLLVLEREHILDFKRMVETLQQVTVAHLSPSLLRKLIAFIKDLGVDTQTFSQLKHISSGGDMVSADLLESMKQVFPTAEIYVLYGSSEVSCMGCFYDVPRDRVLTKSRVGKPFNNVSVRLYDPHQNLVPVGVVGEVYFGGAGITRGYLNREELTQEKFVLIDGQRFYRMGDLGRFDAEGNLELLGRSDFQIKLRGIRIEPGEIEAALRKAPGIREGIVVARELGSSEKSLVAYVVLNPNQQFEIEQVRSFLQSKLPDYMVPVAFVVLDAMPVNMNQKVDRRALPEPTPENLAGFKPYMAPRDDHEQRLVSIWEGLLGISPIGVQDNFFDVGGDSLQAVTLMMLIEQEFGKNLPLSTLLTEPTIEQLAAVLKQSKQSDIHNSIVLLRKGGSKPPLFLVHDGEGETLLYRNLAVGLNPEHPVYGVQPYSRDGFPMLHTRIEDITAYYLEQIRKVQPHGPYLLGGLCIGGFLAFEVARELQKQGEQVAMVALIDTADLEAPVRASLASKRLGSLSKSLSESQHLSRHQRLLSVFNIMRKKVSNVVAYEVQTRVKKAQAEGKLKLLRFCLDRGTQLPSFLQNIPVRVVLRFAEKGYVPDARYRGEVMLFRATQKSSVFDGTEIDDTPYSEIYSDPLLGWEKRVTQGVRVYDTPGGHSSMLQEPNVQVIAQAMQTYIDVAIANYEQSSTIRRTMQSPDRDGELSHSPTDCQLSSSFGR
ncbi:MAG: enterobactin synthase subunit F [Leptolyngbyaceae cyanobacterium bins.302]|nr:enterobactin synthase subunit F [Leptolyngbyaceae cyanobacterium bins.302]